MSTTIPGSVARWTSMDASAVVIARDDIDTDQIIPARFLTTTSRTGLGVHCFADWRYDTAGTPRADFALNRDVARGAQILVGGQNFGCGSSREHAPWSIVDAGFRVVIAGSFADIFRANAHKNGLLTAAIGPAISELQAYLANHPSAHVRVDLPAQTVCWLAEHAYPFAIDAFSKRALAEGLDELGMLVTHIPQIQAWESRTGRQIA